MNGPARLRALLASPGVLQAGGVGDAGQALLVQQVGYPAVYVSGAYVNHTRGFPDGTLTLSEIADRVREVAERVAVPVIADADEGFGGTLMIVRTVREFERGGAAALHLEDMLGKKHGDLLPPATMGDRLKVALDTRKDPAFAVIARTDALAPWRPGVEHRDRCEQDARERLHAYAEAGADLLMPLFASMDWVRRYGPEFDQPLVLLSGAARGWHGRTPDQLELDLPAPELEPFNVKVVLYGTSMLSRSFNFMEREYRQWLQEGRFAANAQDEVDRAAANRLVGLEEKERLLRKYGD
jgi:2-methylisocitrate lyase-like PEP mutase family enzyme